MWACTGLQACEIILLDSDAGGGSHYEVATAATSGDSILRGEDVGVAASHFAIKDGAQAEHVSWVCKHTIV